MPSPFKSLAASLPRTVELDYFPALVNPLVVSAGPDLNMHNTLIGTLNGSTFIYNGSDITLLWTLVSGPGTVIFTDITAAVTGFEVSDGGVYVFKLTATSGDWSLSDEATAYIDPLPVPAIAMATTSEAGSGTMFGFSEQASPSVPPRKYRTGTLSGFQGFCVTGCGAETKAASKKVWVGGLSFSPITGAKTITGVREDYTDGGGANCGVVRNVGGDQVLVNNNFFPGGNENTPMDPLELINNALYLPPFILAGKTLKSAGYDPGGTCFAPGYNWDGTARLDLTDEDTEPDAMLRASVTPGTSATAAIEPRGAGDFTFNFVAVSYDLNCSNLGAGIQYTVTVDLLTENYGGGSPVTTQQQYNFTAAGTTHTIPDAIVCPSGKQVTVSNPTIVIV